jgi:hypothetical protein
MTVSLGDVLLLLMVTMVEELSVPTGAEKVVIDCGVTPTVALPLPLSETRCGLVELSSVISSVADLGPEARGVNVTDTVQLPSAGMLLPQGFGPVLDHAKSPGLAPVIGNGVK